MSFFFFNDTATTEIYTLSLHDALPIYRDDGDRRPELAQWCSPAGEFADPGRTPLGELGSTITIVSVDPSGHTTWKVDRKSTRLNSSHSQISYAVFCLKKKKNTNTHIRTKQNSRKMMNPIALAEARGTLMGRRTKHHHSASQDCRAPGSTVSKRHTMWS